MTNGEDEREQEQEGEGEKLGNCVLIDLWSERFCPLICKAEERALVPEVLLNKSISGLGFLSIPTRSFFII